MFRSERFIGRLARLSFAQTSKWMILAFFGTLAALGMSLGGFAGLFYMQHVSTPWLLTYLTCAGFLMWKAAFHTVLPSPALDRITTLVDNTTITGEGIAHHVCRDTYQRSSVFGYYQAVMNILLLFWVVAFYLPDLPISALIFWGILCVIAGKLFSWHPLNFWLLLLNQAKFNGISQTLEEAIFEGEYPEKPTESEDTEESSESERA